MLDRPVDAPPGLPFGYDPTYPTADHFHKGKDWLAVKGSPCWFREPGVITFTGLVGELGNYVQMQSDRDASLWWGLAHLSVIQCAVGQAVDAGEVVGLTGGVPGDYGSGLSTGQHCHEEARTGSQWGQRVDPEQNCLREEPEMQTIISSMNKAWMLLDAIQAHPEATQAVIDLAERVKQEAVVQVKITLGIQ